MISKRLKISILGIVVALSMNIVAGAETLKKFYFTGVTNSEKIVFTIDERKDTLDHYTRAKDYHYIVTDYDYSVDENYGNELFKCTVADTLYGKEYQVLLTHNDSYTDIRIGSQRIRFTHVDEFVVEK